MKMSVTIKKQIKWYESFGNLKKKKNRTEKSVTHLHLGYCVHLWSFISKGISELKQILKRAQQMVKDTEHN